MIIGGLKVVLAGDGRRVRNATAAGIVKLGINPAFPMSKLYAFLRSTQPARSGCLNEKPLLKIGPGCRLVSSAAHSGHFQQQNGHAMDAVTIISCGKGHKLRVPVGLGPLVVTCPRCGDRFEWKASRRVRVERRQADDRRPSERPPLRETFRAAASRPWVQAVFAIGLPSAGLLVIAWFIWFQPPKDAAFHAALALPAPSTSTLPLSPLPTLAEANRRPLPAPSTPALPVSTPVPLPISSALLPQLQPKPVTPSPAKNQGLSSVPARQAIPLPQTGMLRRWFAGSPLPEFRFVTRAGDGNHYMKIEDWTTRQPIATLFAKDGDSVTIHLPPGIYRVKCAEGSVWYGPEFLFGPSTSCYVADKAFSFEVRPDDSGESYDVRTVELFKQVSGNLNTSSIPVDDF